MMKNIENNEKIAFCITCMNRLKHIQQTLEKNIHDNYLKDKVEFVLLDYNSQDGLEEWVLNNMQKYIDEGILVYYKTTEPAHYLRSHSRNMAFRLANATILCNLDADNYLGKGFAAFMLHEFSKQDGIFYTNNCLVRDTFGRISVRIEDFISIRGYNEALHGYGYEDGDFQNRLVITGLKPICFNEPEFYHCIKHTYCERISEESMSKNLSEIFITYINPYTSGFLLLNKDNTFEQYTLVNNTQLNVLVETSNIFDCFYDDKSRTILLGDIEKGTWHEDNNMLYINKNSINYQVEKKMTAFNIADTVFYRVKGDEHRAVIITLLNDAINYKEACKQISEQSLINPDGFGKGIVYKNFDLSKKIILS